MHNFENSSSNVPAFLVKLWKLVQDNDCNELITWNDTGTTFIIRNQTKFAKDLLPQYFKHNNMASFIRQLNMYGFRKVINYEKSGLRCENDEIEFQHSFFCKGQGELLELIKRKLPNTRVAEPTVKSNARDIITDLTSIREKQESMDNMLSKMKQENELLWRELTGMRQKHKAQEQIIQKVIQFLVSIVQRSNQNIGIKRKITRMLHDSPGNKGKTSQVARHIAMRRKSNSDCFITVPQDKSPLGPVIHEVLDYEHEDIPHCATATISTPSPAADGVPEVECPLNSNLNSPIDTSETMEPLSILEALHSSSPVATTEQDATEEHILGLPLDLETHNVISIPEEGASDVFSQPGTSYVLSPLIFSPATSPGCEDLTESLLTPQVPSMAVEETCSTSTDDPKNNVVATTCDVSLAEEVCQTENKYQLAVTDSSLVKANALTQKNPSAHESHLERMFDDQLTWLQSHTHPSSWNDYASTLLELFSSDEVANNECLAEQIAGEEHTVKTERNDIVGNELVQFTPSLLDIEHDVFNSPFLDYLTRDTEVSTFHKTGDAAYEQEDLINILSGTVGDAKNIKSECILNNGTSLDNSSKRLKTHKEQKSKKRKVK